MKRAYKIFVIILLIGLAIFLLINYKQNNNKEDNPKVKENKTEEVKEEEKEKTEEVKEEETKELEEYTFEDEYGNGEETKVKAYEYVRLSGFAGAGNHVFYIDEDHNLIYLNGSEKTVLSDNIIDLSYNPETDTFVTAYYKDKHNIKEENKYIQYEKK